MQLHRNRLWVTLLELWVLLQPPLLLLLGPKVLLCLPCQSRTPKPGFDTLIFVFSLRRETSAVFA